MTKTKRIWAAVIAFCMLFTLIPMAAFAEDGEGATYETENGTNATSGTCGENLTWSYDETTKILTISGTGEMYSYYETAVTFRKISPWRENEEIKNNLEKVVITGGVTAIGSYAFYECPTLKEVVLSESVTEIRSNAFYGCTALKTISIDKVTKLWSNVFTGCNSLESVTLAEGLTYVSGGTFSDCEGLKSVYIPSSVTSFEEGFYGCTSLESITVADGNTVYSSQDEVLYNKDKTTLIKFPLNKSVIGFTIPDTVTEVEGNAFYGHQKEDEYDENGLLIVGKWIVGTKDIVGETYEIVVNDSVTHIADGIFVIENLKSISVPKSITSIGIGAFSGESLTRISVSEENTAYSSENGILYNKDKTELIQYPIGKTDEEITLADTVKKIGSLAFSYNKHLKKAELPGVEEIGDFALAYTDVEDVTLSPSLKKIGSWSFAWCEKLEKADLPEGVEYIGSQSFNQCKALKSIHIPESVTFVGEYAFNNTYICDTTGSGKVYYHDNWLLYVGGYHDLSGSFEVQDGTVGICERALYYQPDITSVSIPISVKYINESAFDGDGSLSEINYGGNKISWDKIIKYEDMPTTIKINYTKEKPTGKPNVRMITESGKTLADANLITEASSLSVEGTAKWVADDGVTPLDPSTVVEANKYYKWLFTPTDTDNYETLTGTIKLYSKSSGGGGGGGTTRYTVSFETNGGNKISSERVKRNNTLTEPTAPTKEGFDFAGWYTDKELKEKYDFSSKVTKSLTLYAAWTEKDNSENQLILTIGEKSAKVFGKTKTNDVAPKIVSERTMLPARFVAENLGAKVEWDGEKELVTITGKNLKTGEDVTILITIGAINAVVNGKDIKLDSPAFVENDRTYTPIRFISEHLGASVEWVEKEQKVVITKVQAEEK